MWIGVTKRFSDFNGELLVTTQQRDDAVGKAVRIAEILQRAYYNSDDALANLLIVGSWGKGTQVRPSNDLDMMFALPRHVFERFDAYQGNKQSALLADVRGHLTVPNARTDIRADGQVVVVDYQTITIEVVPVLPKGDGQVIMPDTRNGGRWKTADPLAQIRRIEAVDNHLRGHLRPLTRMMKQWRRERNVPIKSFLLELLCVEFLVNYRHNDQSFFYFDWFVRDFLAFMIARRNTSLILPGTNEAIPLGDDWVSRAQTAHAIAVMACAYEREDWVGLAGDEWQKIFGPRIAKWTA